MDKETLILYNKQFRLDLNLYLATKSIVIAVIDGST